MFYGNQSERPDFQSEGKGRKGGETFMLAITYAQNPLLELSYTRENTL